MNDYIETKSNGTIKAKKASNKRELYDHQRQAMRNLDIINQNNSYSTLVVLPTGGGKTYTAAVWLLRNAIDRKKKVLWLAHRQTLLDQAAETFQNILFQNISPVFHLSNTELYQVRQSTTGLSILKRRMTYLL